MNNFQKMLDLLGELQQHKIHFTLENNSPEAIMVMIAVPGECWEVEFFANKPVRVEVFRTLGISHNYEEERERLFRDFGD